MSSSAGWALGSSMARSQPGSSPRDTHTAAADEHYEEGLQHTGCAHHPGQPQEEDDPEDVLQAGKVHSHEGAHAGCLNGQEGRGHTASERSRYATGRSTQSLSSLYTWDPVEHRRQEQS